MHALAGCTHRVEPPQPVARRARGKGRAQALVRAAIAFVAFWATVLAPSLAYGTSRSRGASSAGKLIVSKGTEAPYLVTTRRFHVEFSVAPKTGLSYAVLCERAYRNFCRKFAVTSSEVVWQGRCHVYIFAGREEFATFAQEAHNARSMAGSGGYCRPRQEDPAIVLFLDDDDHRRLKRVLVHEMTHVFLQLFGRQVKLHTWLHEGWAQYFEFSYDPAGSRLAKSRATTKQLVKRRRHTPLSKFWTQKFGSDDIDSYAQAWSLIDFMVKKGSAKKAGDFVLALKNGLDQQEALRQVFGCSLDRFEALWKRYVVTAY